MERKRESTKSSTKLTAGGGQLHQPTTTSMGDNPKQIELPEKILRRIRLNKNFVNVYTPFHDMEDEDYQITVSVLIILFCSDCCLFRFLQEKKMRRLDKRSKLKAQQQSALAASSAFGVTAPHLHDGALAGLDSQIGSAPNDTTVEAFV